MIKKHKSFLGVHKSRLDCPRHKWLILQFVGILEGMFNLCTLGFFTARWKSALLFSEWMEDE